MSTVAEIIDAVKRLNAEEKSEFLERLNEVEFEDAWDRQMQADAAVRFCEALFGREYASLMSRAVDNALSAERKPSRAG